MSASHLRGRQITALPESHNEVTIVAVRIVLVIMHIMTAAGCVFPAPCGADFDVERGALKRCEEGGPINSGWVEDPESGITVFEFPSGLPDSQRIV